MTPSTPQSPVRPITPPTLAEAARATPAYFAPEPATKTPLRELSVIEQMYGYYEAA